MKSPVRTDAGALTSFAQQGLKLFWFRQIMFVGATIITTTYLGSPIPLACYLACLGAEIAEVALGRRILAAEALTEDRVQRFTLWETLIAAWSAAAVSIYGLIVAYMGDEAFLFVPLTYVFAAALYGTTFNHAIRPVLIARMGLYVAGFLAIGGLGLLTAPPERHFLDYALFITTLSAAFFFVINATVFHMNYAARQEREATLTQREALLQREIEERKLAEAARHSSEARFQSLFDSAPIPIREEDLSGMKRRVDTLGLPDPSDFQAYLDAHPEFLEACAQDIVVLDANRAALEEHGYAAKPEMLSKVVRRLSPAAKRVVRKTLTTIHTGASGASYETKITRADGKTRTVAATWSVLPGYEDSYARILLCSVDLTERLAAEEALRQAQKMEAVGQLTGGVAHDFNNLLTVIRGNLDLLEAGSALDADLSGPIHKAVHRGAELTQRLLAFSRKQPLAARPIQLAGLIQGMTALIRRSLGEDCQLALDMESRLWPAFADPGQVETALLNLALNARDAMPEGGTLRISCRNSAVGPQNRLELDPGDYVMLSVSDTGTGMAPEVIARAFEPFFTTKEVGKGSGLGLSMAYGFAKQSGGTLDIASTEGMGTTLTLYLPRSKTRKASDAAPEATAPATQGQGETVLLLEDDHDVRAYLSRLMRSFGYQALQASDAHAARQILGQRLEAGQKIDLLISDIMLPGGVRGPEFAAEMLVQAPDTPVIFVSGHPTEIETAGLEQTKILTKPFSKAEISQRILEAFGQAETVSG